jgi:hypothetical protein
MKDQDTVEGISRVKFFVDTPKAKMALLFLLAQSLSPTPRTNRRRENVKAKDI